PFVHLPAQPRAQVDEGRLEMSEEVLVEVQGQEGLETAVIGEAVDAEAVRDRPRKGRCGCRAGGGHAGLLRADASSRAQQAAAVLRLCACIHSTNTTDNRPRAEPE